MGTMLCVCIVKWVLRWLGWVLREFSTQVNVLSYSLPLLLMCASVWTLQSGASYLINDLWLIG